MFAYQHYFKHLNMFLSFKFCCLRDIIIHVTLKSIFLWSRHFLCVLFCWRFCILIKSSKKLNVGIVMSRILIRFKRFKKNSGTLTNKNLAGNVVKTAEFFISLPCFLQSLNSIYHSRNCSKYVDVVVKIKDAYMFTCKDQIMATTNRITKKK